MKKVYAIVIIILAALIMEGCSMSNRNTIKKINDAIKNDDIDRVAILLKKCSDVNENPYTDLEARVFGYVNVSPLNAACFYGNFKIIKMLLDYGADVNNQNNPSKSTPLINALSGSKTNRFEIAKYLIEQGADVNAVSINDLTAVFYVVNTVDPYDVEAQETQLDMILFMEENGCDIYHESISGNLLFQACICSNVKLLDYLINEREFDINFTSRNGDNALLRTIKNFYREQYIVVEMLLENGICLTSTDKDGYTAIELARMQGNDKLVQLINKYLE